MGNTLSANDKTGVGGGQGSWQTPPELYAWLKKRFAFNFDLFAEEGNALERQFATQHGVFDDRSGYSPGISGLDCDLSGRRAYGNPPYTTGFIAQAVDSMIDRREQADTIVALLPAATETRWFQRLYAVSHVEFLPRRVRFIHPPTPCIDREGQSCFGRDKNRHIAGQPGDSPPGGHIIAMMRQDMP